MKVYGWTGYRAGGQTREIVAANSWSEVARLTGDSRYYLMRYGDRTFNDAEIAAATAQPHVVLWRALDDHDGPYRNASTTTRGTSP